MNMLRSIRERKGLTVGQLAARASIPSRVLTEYEEGRQPIPLPHAKLLAKALWVQIEDLLPAAGTAPPAPNPTAAPPAPTVAHTPRPQPQTPASQGPRPAPPAAPPPQARTPGTAPPVQGPPRDTQNGVTQATHGGVPPQPRPAGAPAPQSQVPAGGRGPGGAVGGGGRGWDPAGRPGARPPSADARKRPPRPLAAPPKNISEGQVEELMRLAARLEIEQAKVEESMGKTIQALSRVEAKEWIKRLRDMAEEIGGATPGSKVRFGQWPGSREDREALYLARYRESGAMFHFKLFNGEEFRGTIADYTPYTITVKLDGQDDLVLRKLAIAYYRQAPEGAAAASPPAEAAPKAEKATRTSARKKSTGEAGEAGKQGASQEHHQPADEGLDSDRAGEPANPELDNMDEDRGI